MDDLIEKKALAWLGTPFDEATQAQVRDLMTRPEALYNAFYKNLTFGTGGMRGLMGVGTNRMNIYTIRAATQGLANYLLKQPGKKHSVFIGFDVRNNSKEFAREAARVLAANSIHVYLAKEICPTPLVSYGCRHYKCSAAIMITASHNPPSDNGYKVYWNDGGQVVFPHDEAIIDEVNKIDITAPIQAIDSPLIHPVGPELDEVYLKELKKLQLFLPSPVKILYTPLHGTGIRIIPQALSSWGYDSVSLVPEQKNPDGNFTNAKKPNPEELAALEIGSKQLIKEQHDLLIATDPDADRIGVVVLHDNKAVPLTGNQTACIVLYHICTALIERGEFPENGAFIKTIVTTELFRKIAESFGGKCLDVLTGFKYIAEKMTLWEKSFDAYQFIFGAEESYGCLIGTMVRDKDAISASCIIAEAAAHAKKLSLTLVDRLHQIYQLFGTHREGLKNIPFKEGAAGMAEMKALMDRLRKNPPKSINSIPVTSFTDYLAETDLPKSDVLRFILADKSKLVIRPSGTEPKIKIYGEVVELSPSERIMSCDQRLQSLMESLSLN